MYVNVYIECHSMQPSQHLCFMKMCMHKPDALIPVTHVHTPTSYTYTTNRTLHTSWSFIKNRNIGNVQWVCPSKMDFVWTNAETADCYWSSATLYYMVIYWWWFLIWRFSKFHKDCQTKCTPFVLQAWASFHKLYSNH